MELLDDIQSAKMIPVNIPAFLEDLDGRLKKTLSGLAPEFDTTEICTEWNRTKEVLEKAGRARGKYGGQ